MESIKVAEVSDGATNQSRREALKRFGRYAAAAPAAMVLLQPRASHAGKSGGRGNSSRGRGWVRGPGKGGGHY
jgi:hypothetical protein